MAQAAKLEGFEIRVQL